MFFIYILYGIWLILQIITFLNFIRVNFYLIKLFDLAVKMNASVNHIEQLLGFVGELFTEFKADQANEWPKTYATAMTSMKNYGYIEPTATNVCFSDSHPLHWYNVPEKENECPDCGEKPSIKFYYMSLSEKILKWMRSPEMCEKMLGHWDEKESWLNKTGVTFPVKEIWDGYRFKDVEWFWNPQKEWYLPKQCSSCERYVSFEESSGNKCPFCNHSIHSSSYKKVL